MASNRLIAGRGGSLGSLAAGPLLVCVLLLAGCGPQRTSTLGDARAAYEAHRYSTAHDHAVKAMRSSTGREREQATYLAGLSAYLLGNIDEAELRLSTASRASDAEVAASAKAMLGQVRLDQNRPGEAATLFEEAARGLSGDDAREAARYAALARQQAGGSAGSSGNAFAGGSGGFALQVGAFQDQRRASMAADDAKRVADNQGLGPVSVVPRRDSRGRQMYLVQFGRFDSRSSAASARERLGRLDYIVAPVASP